MISASMASAPRDFDDLRRVLASSDRSSAPAQTRGAWIHGAGSFGRGVAKILATAGIPVLGFIDRRGPNLVMVDGLRVLHPDALEDQDVSGATHFHGLMNDATPSAEISDWAAGRGFDHLLFPTDLYRIAGVDLHHYWLAPPSQTLQHLSALEAVHDALADDESRTILRTLMRYRLNSDPRLHPDTDRPGCYTPHFLPIFDSPINFVDGGAFTGDSVEALLGRGIAIADWIAFEPDPDNFERLRDTAQRIQSRVGAYTLYCLGLSDTNAQVGFSNGGGAASRIMTIDASATAVNVVRADDVMNRDGCVYIKLDVEGAELAALRGMERLLTQKPTLAVSIYHRPQDLWEIPLYLMQRQEGAEFYIRQHGYHGFDTVLYVVPK